MNILLWSFLGDCHIAIQPMSIFIHNYFKLINLHRIYPLDCKLEALDHIDNCTNNHNLYCYERSTHLGQLH